MISVFAPLATDMYLPGFARMARSFETDGKHIEATLSSFFFGLALGQVFYGPLIDRFGRRKPLLLGIGLYLLATLGCCWTSDINVFIALRIVQAIGGCAGMIIGRAVVDDLFDETESARALSLLMVLMAVGPIAAPLLGGWILAANGWRMIFVFMLAFGAICAAVTWFGLPETLPMDRRPPLNLRAAIGTYGGLCTRPGFIVPALVGGLAGGGMFAFITGSAFVFMGLFKVSEQHFVWLFGLNALGLIIGAQANRLVLRRLTVQTTLSVALLVNMLASICLASLSGAGSLAFIMLPLWCVIFSLGFIGANSAAVAMAASNGYAGSASALIGLIQFACAFSVSSIVAATQNSTAYPMALAIAGCGTGAVALWFVPSRSSANRTPSEMPGFRRGGRDPQQNRGQ
jgi:MFS transporter, DHA1 family, multidrug resistance protein